MRIHSQAIESQFHIDCVTHSRIHEVDFATVTFSGIFSDHMFSAEFQEGRWSDGRIQPYGPILVAVPRQNVVHPQK